MNESLESLDLMTRQACIALQRRIDRIDIEQVFGLSVCQLRLNRKHIVGAFCAAQHALARVGRDNAWAWLNLDVLQNYRNNRAMSDVHKLVEQMNARQGFARAMRVEPLVLQLDSAFERAHAAVLNAAVALCARDLLIDRNVVYSGSEAGRTSGADASVNVHGNALRAVLASKEWRSPHYELLGYPWRFAMRAKLHPQDEVGFDHMYLRPAASKPV